MAKSTRTKKAKAKTGKSRPRKARPRKAKPARKAKVVRKAKAANRSAARSARKRTAATAATRAAKPRKPAPAKVTFSAGLEVDATTGWTVAVLRCAHAGAPERDLEARIAPDAGANLFWLTIGGEQVLVQPDAMEDLRKHRSGTPVMHPMPNRVRNGVFTFEGRTYTFEPNNAGNFIHGLVRQRPWRSETPVAGPREAAVAIWIDWSPEQPDFARFPIPHRLTITYRLTADAIAIEYAVENKAEQRLPFGFGLHPWFRVPGDRRDVALHLPVTHRMEAVDRLPTGKLIPVENSRWDLRTPMALEGLDLDDVYIGVTPAARPYFEWRDRRVRVSFIGTRDLTHFVVYTPPGQAYFCMENQTCSTDAHNLHQQGLKDQAHLLFAEPGKTARGRIDWKLERLPQA